MFRLADKWRRHDIEALGEGGEHLKIMAGTARCINCSQCIGQCPICGDSGLLKKNPCRDSLSLSRTPGSVSRLKEKIFGKSYGKNTGLGLFLTNKILSITGILIREKGIAGKGARLEITVPQGTYRIAGK